MVSKRFAEVRLWILWAAAAAMERNPPAVAQDHLASETVDEACQVTMSSKDLP